MLEYFWKDIFFITGGSCGQNDGSIGRLGEGRVCDSNIFSQERNEEIMYGDNIMQVSCIAGM